MQSRAPLQAGDIVHGRYTVERLLGRGAFGATYLVHDTERFGAACALKELVPQQESITHKARELFEREARVLGDLRHEQVPALHAYFEEDGRYYLVQALVEGRTLDSVLEESGPLGEDEVRRLVTEVLNVLIYLHRHDPPVVHRDIKPSNLIRDADGRVNVIDFGAVRAALAGVPAASNVTMIGTPGYAPLEQALGAPVPSSDLHALGMTALHLLTGKGPSEWRDSITAEPSVIGRTGASRDFERFLARMVADLPERFETAEQAIADLTGGATMVDARRAPRQAATVVDAQPPADSGNPRRRLKLKRYASVIGIGAVASSLAIWSATRDKAQEGITQAPDSVRAAVAEALDRESTLRTAAGIDLAVRHPGAWLLTSTAADGYIALQDPRTTGVFVASLDRSSDPAPQFARQWAVSISRKFGRVELLDVGQYDAAGSFWRFKLGVHRSTASEGGLLVVETPPETNGPTVYRWWALIGQSPANTATALAMANSLTTRRAAP